MKVPFRFLSNSAAVGNVKQITLLNGSLSDGTDVSSRLDAIGPMYAFYRFKRIKITIYPLSSSTAAVCYVPANTGVTAPTSLEDAVEEVHGMYIGGMTVPRSMTLGFKALRGLLDWYRSSTSGVDVTETSQGIIFIRTSGATDTYQVVVEGIIEYRDAVDSAVAITRIKEKVRKEVVQEMGLKMIASTSIPTSK